MKKITATLILALMASNLMAATPPPGRVLMEYWTGIPYSSVDDLTNSTNYPYHPNFREYSSVMEIPQNMNTNSGTRVRGFFYAPSTGTYQFAIASSNSSSLLFSTNSSPGNATQIASVSGQTGYQIWTNYPTQISGSITLTQGQVCYLEALHKTGTGSSNLSIGWKAPGTGSITLMPATNVAPYDAGVAYTSNAIAKFCLPFTHPRLMVSPAAILRLKNQVTSGTPQYDVNQYNSWGRISNVCTGTTSSDLMPMGDATLKGSLISNTTGTVEVALTQTPPAGGPLLTSARNLENRVYVLSMYYLLESQLSPGNAHLQQALNQIMAELQAAQSWGTFTTGSGTLTGIWDGNNQLDMAEMTNAYSIAYDWCYNGWTPAQRAFLVNTISKQALAEDAGQDGNPTGKGNQLGAWPYAGTTIEGNWGFVCNGGAILGALAILGDETTGTGGTLTSPNTPQAENVLNACVVNLPSIHSMTDLAPDGGWAEGPGYWGFAMQYLTLTFASLETTSATCFNLDQVTGLSNTDSFLTYDTGPTGLAFNFSDSEQSTYNLPAQQYLGLKYNTPLYSYPENIFTDGAGHYPTDMLWHDPRVQAPNANAQLSAYYDNMGLISLRDSWTNTNALFVGIKGGYNASARSPSVSHEMEQLGSFVFEALGVRWAYSLGADLNYYGTPYFDVAPWDPNNRWQYYRCRAEGNNTLVINPTTDGGQTCTGSATMTDFETGASEQMTIIDMSTAYAKTDGNHSNQHFVSTAVTSAKRGFRILAGNTGYSDIMQMQDEVATSSSQQLWWFMHTPIPSNEIVITPANTQTHAPSTAVLTDSTGVNHLLMTLQSPSGASFLALSAAPFGSSPIPSGGQTVNTGVTKLGINFATATSTTNTLTVTLAPYTTGQGGNPTLPSPVPLSTW
jgi:hypothetical protein